MEAIDGFAGECIEDGVTPPLALTQRAEADVVLLVEEAASARTVVPLLVGQLALDRIDGRSRINGGSR